MMAISLHQISIENAMRCIDMGSDTSAIRLDLRVHGRSKIMM